jgi:UDP-3-O-[3-hydroxymyristoyl] N-acetylglucosamine deacetylase
MPVPVVRQQTLKTAISCTGVGLHSGVTVQMVLRPAPDNHGLVFRRSDLWNKAGDEARSDIRASWQTVTDSRLCTVLGNDAGTTVATVEHLMAALAGCSIDNALIEVSAPELPVMDGSAAPFVFLIECAGVQQQEAPRRALRILQRMTFEEGSKRIGASPAPSFSLDCEIDYSDAVVSRQRLTTTLDPASFKREISRARTFGFVRDLDRMWAAGLARGGSLDNAVVVSDHGVVNPEGLRYRDEFVRHKALDCIGDLYLAGGPILGHVRAVRAGHAFNNRFLQNLFAREDAWRWVDLTGAYAVGFEATQGSLAAAGD